MRLDPTEPKSLKVEAHCNEGEYEFTTEDGRVLEPDDFKDATLYADRDMKDKVEFSIVHDRICITLKSTFGTIEQQVDWDDLSVPLYAVWPVNPRVELLAQVENIIWDAITDEGMKKILVIYNEERQDLNGANNDAVCVIKNRHYKY